MRVYIILAFLAAPAVLWAGWTSETVASEGDVGDGCSLAVDRWGRPHITYKDTTKAAIVYASFVNSAWVFQTIAEDAEYTCTTALTVDPSDRPHVVFPDDKEEKITYAYRSGNNWLREVVDTGPALGQFLSITAWPSGLKVAYVELKGTAVNLKYAYKDAESWETEYVVSGKGGDYNKIFVDNNGTPHIVYHNGNSESIKHAVRGTTGWNIDDIAEGINSCAVFGPDKKIHVSFAKVNNVGLTYAVSTPGGSWKFENVTAAVGRPGFNQICVNGVGDVFISYFEWGSFNLHIVMKVDGSWKHEVVAASSYVGLPHSIALGPDGYPLIAYYDDAEGDLKLARYYFTDVELTSFAAKRAHGGVEIRWAVHGANEVAGYNLYRGTAGGQREMVNAALIEGVSPFRYVDARAAENVALKYWLEAVATTGTKQTFGPASVPPAAKTRAFALHQNVPNPFARATAFAFELPEASDVKLVIFDAAGRKVADVAGGHFAAGRHEVPYASDLAPGVYVYRLDAGSRTAARKMVVTK